MEDIYHNKNAFLNELPRKFFSLGIVFGTILLVILILAGNIKVYDHYLTKGYVECDDACYIISFIPTDIAITKVKLNNKSWNYDLKSRNIEIDEDNMISYYRIEFLNNLNLLDKEIVDLSFYYNKESILKKIHKKIF